MSNLEQNLKPIYAFIDSQNLNLGVKEQGWNLDFKKFRVYLAEKYAVEKAFLFIGYVQKNTELYKALQNFGYIVIFKPTLFIKENSEVTIKGNVDAELVLHTMIELPNYDKAIIVSGDGDFYCLLEYLEKKGMLYKLIIPNERKFSQLLQSLSHKISFINNNLRKKLERIKTGGDT